MGPKKKTSVKGTAGGNKSGNKQDHHPSKHHHQQFRQHVSQPTDNPMGIDISIDSITFFDTTALQLNKKEYPKFVTLRVTFGDELLSISEPIKITNEWYHKINFSCYYGISQLDAQIMDDLCKQPFIITLMELHDSSEKSDSKNGPGSGGKMQGGGASSIGGESPSVRPSKQLHQPSLQGSLQPSSHAFQQSSEHVNDSNINTPDLVLHANVDVLPLLLGETDIKETVVLRPPHANPWLVDSCLPRIEVTVAPINILFLNESPIFSNLLCITLESLYNPLKEIMNCDAFCSATLSVLVKPEQETGAEAQVLEMNFEHPEIDSSRCQEDVKRWFTLSQMTNASLSNYRNRDDFLDVKNPGGIDLKSSLESTNPKIKWNQFRRTWMPTDIEEGVFKNLLRYKTWLLELKFNLNNKNDAFLNKLSKHELDTGSEGMYHFVAYLDVSNLLYPGVNSTRVVAQLMTINEEDMKVRTGLDKPIIYYLLDRPVSVISRSGKSSRRSKIKGGKKPPSAAVTKKGLAQEVEEDQQVEEKGKKEDKAGGGKKGSSEGIGTGSKSSLDKKNGSEVAPQTTPIYDAEGRPVFIIVQIELYKAFKPRKTTQQLIQSISEVLVPRTRVPKEAYLKKTAQDCFQSCIRKITVLIGKEYEDFVGVWNVGLEHCHTDYISVSEEPDFYDYLMVSSGYQTIKDTLRNCLVNYVRDCIGPPQETSSQSLKRYAGLLFSRLVDETHIVLNGMLTESDEEPSIDTASHVDQIELLFCAVEASEQGDYQGAKENLMKRLHYYGDKNAEYWVDLGVICMRHGDVARAESSLRTALTIYPRCRDGLLMYAVLMAMEGRHEMAEMFFDALTQFYPRFFQGWFTFHMFYNLIERKEGADITIVLASKCLMDFTIDSSPKDYRRLMLSWCPAMGPIDNGYFQTAVYLISLCLFEFAEMCLAQELEQKKEETLHYLYYLGVSHHVQGKYSESNSHLDMAINTAWNDDRIWSLMGHNYYKMGDMDNAKRCYQVAYDCPDRPDDIHLTFIRLAEINISEENYEEAKNLYLNALSQNSSTAGWFGLGKVYYLMDDLENSEIAMNECNLMDNRNPNVWAYLGLINILRYKKELGEQCIFEAQKYGLSDPDIIAEINEVMFKNTELEHMYRKVSNG